MKSANPDNQITHTIPGSSEPGNEFPNKGSFIPQALLTKAKDNSKNAVSFLEITTPVTSEIDRISKSNFF